MHRGDEWKANIEFSFSDNSIFQREKTDSMGKNKLIVRIVRHFNLCGLIPIILVPENYKKRLTMSK